MSGAAAAAPSTPARRCAIRPTTCSPSSTPLLTAGDVNARVWIRIREVEQSLSLIGQILASLPAGAIAVALPAGAADGRDGKGNGVCEGMALVEGFRGDVLVWLRIVDGRVARCHLRDPSWFQWPLLEAVIEGNIVADFPLCNKSFNCSYSGHDLRMAQVLLLIVPHTRPAPSCPLPSGERAQRSSDARCRVRGSLRMTPSSEAAPSPKPLR